jgi:hypothetical protein
MALALTSFCNSRIFLIELSSVFIYLHGSYCAVLDVCSLLSLYLCMIRQVILVPRHRLQYSVFECLL